MPFAHAYVASKTALRVVVTHVRDVVVPMRVAVALFCGFVVLFCGFVSVRHVAGVRSARGGRSFGTVAGDRSALWRAMTKWGQNINIDAQRTGGAGQKCDGNAHGRAQKARRRRGIP